MAVRIFNNIPSLTAQRILGVNNDRLSLSVERISSGIRINRAADDAAGKAQKLGLKNLNVKVKGPGSGRETALRAFQARGFKILSIRDTTPMPHNGSRPPKKRRV